MDATTPREEPRSWRKLGKSDVFWVALGVGNVVLAVWAASEIGDPPQYQGDDPMGSVASNLSGVLLALGMLALHRRPAWLQWPLLAFALVLSTFSCARMLSG